MFLKNIQGLVFGMSMMSVLAVGCTGETGEAVDNTVLEPTLDTRIELIAQKACARFDECGNIGEGDGNTYQTMSECRSEMESDFYELWPSDECSDGRVNSDKYDDCVARSESYSCDDNIFDFISYYSECSANDVCTDPADQ